MVNNNLKLQYNQKSWTPDAPRPNIPPMLHKKGVTASEWAMIFDAFHTQLAPAIYVSEKHETIYQKEMAAFTGKQMGKGYIGFGQESHHEKKVHGMVHQSSVLQNNATLIASNVVAMANAILMKYGIMVQLILRSQILAKYSTKQTKPNKQLVPAGLEFIVM